MSSSLQLQSGHCSVQGRRKEMEDEICIKEQFEVIRTQDTNNQVRLYSFYAVFDGHSGIATASYCRDHLCNIFIQKVQSHALDDQTAECDPSIDTSLTESFLEVDQLFEKQATLDNDCSGTTAVVVVIDHKYNRLHAAWAGDSRAVLIRQGAPIRVTRDHKADRPDEVRRIVKAGGAVYSRRVMGQLAISRAIGDYTYKQPDCKMVLAEPELFNTVIQADDYICLACDGVFDVMNNYEVAQFIHAASIKGRTEQEIADAIVPYAIKQYSSDNITTIIIKVTNIKQAEPIGMKQCDENQVAVIDSTNQHVTTSDTPNSVNTKKRKLNFVKPTMEQSSL